MLFQKHFSDKLKGYDQMEAVALTFQFSLTLTSDKVLVCKGQY